MRAISARVGIEGRNAIIFFGLVFCGFGMWLFDKSYTTHPRVSVVFLLLLFALGAAAILVGLLVKPQPSEVAQKFLLQQIGQQFFYAGGLQSQQEMISLLRTAHNIRDLPPPAARVEGIASNESDYKALDPSEAAEIARRDRDEVQRIVEREASVILNSVGGQQMPMRSTKEIGAGTAPEKQEEPGSRSTK